MSMHDVVHFVSPIILIPGLGISLRLEHHHITAPSSDTLILLTSTMSQLKSYESLENSRVHPKMGFLSIPILVRVGFSQLAT